MDILKKIRGKGRKILTEYEAKIFLGHYGIPVTRECLVTDRKQFLAAIRDIGFPLVIKGCVPGIAHKSEQEILWILETKPKL